jgi:hypothetical protein
MWPGEAFGEEAVMTGRASTTVRATVDGELWVISPSVARRLLDHAETVDKEGLQTELEHMFHWRRRSCRPNVVRMPQDSSENQMKSMESGDMMKQVERVEKPGSKALTIVLHSTCSPEAQALQWKSLPRSVWLSCLTGQSMSSKVQLVKRIVEMARLEGYEDIDLMGFSAGGGLPKQVVLDTSERVHNLVGLDQLLKIILCEASALNNRQHGIQKLGGSSDNGWDGHMPNPGSYSGDVPSGVCLSDAWPHQANLCHFMSVLISLWSQQQTQC